MESMESLAYVLALTRIKRRGLTHSERVQDLLAERDPQAVYDRHRYEDADMLRAAAGDELLDQARRDIDTWTNAGYGIVSVLSDRYPTRVREVHEAPALLYYQGALLSDDDGVCVVGSRQAGPASLQAASDVAHRLADRGLTVIAGLAAGIDTAAHQGALDAGGRTVAVMGTGLDRTYPADNTTLRDHIAASGGLILTQFEPGAKITRANFPMRNAIMSGYALTTFVVAAGEHSGTRTQARYAIRHGRGVIVSRNVARSTSWGQEYTHSRNADVADTPDDVLHHVEQIRQQRERATQWADQLLA